MLDCGGDEVSAAATERPRDPGDDGVVRLRPTAGEQDLLRPGADELVIDSAATHEGAPSAISSGSSSARQQAAV